MSSFDPANAFTPPTAIKNETSKDALEERAAGMVARAAWEGHAARVG